MSKTFGQLLDEYLNGQLPNGQSISSIYMYMEDYQTPKLILNTEESDYDYTEILFKAVDLNTQIMEMRGQVKVLQDKIRQLEKSKKEVAKAIKLLKDTP